MRRALWAVVALSQIGCYWARVPQKSLVYTYVCEWPEREKDTGPLQCVPYEDWRGFAPEKQQPPRIQPDGVVRL